MLKLPIIREYSIDDGDGSENVTFKMNSRCFKLCRAYSNSLKMSSECEFPLSGVDFSSFERERKTLCRLWRPPMAINREISLFRYFHVVVVQ